ncbi:hypothetical protein HanIR_Chr16g0808551 [Helianthus annuus]|nr:hypothetical protein HanIR_Chr16g0808551 [Helianthus annuus]
MAKFDLSLLIFRFGKELVKYYWLFPILGLISYVQFGLSYLHHHVCMKVTDYDSQPLHYDSKPYGCDSQPKHDKSKPRDCDSRPRRCDSQPKSDDSRPRLRLATTA